MTKLLYPNKKKNFTVLCQSEAFKRLSLRNNFYWYCTLLGYFFLLVEPVHVILLNVKA